MDIQLRNFLVWIYLTISICLLQSTWADNISRGKPATQLGTWGPYGAGRAVDGDPNQNLDDGSCAHPDGLDGTLPQDVRGRATWWQVDLSDNDDAKLFVIKNVTIYFRTCCRQRVLGVEILAGNSSGVATDPVCVPALSSDEYMQTLACAPSTTVRYLTVSHPSDASLGICEVIVNGYQYQACPSSKWGQDCRLDCNCASNSCNDITGVCAVAVCPDGLFGRNCDGQCNCLDQTEICDQTNGYCPGGCKVGYMDTNCSTPCRDFKFGKGCAFDCHCFDLDERCNPINGGCQSGCDDEYRGPNCSIPRPVINALPIRVSETDRSVTIEFPPSTPRAEEYLVEYAKDDGGFVQYSSGERVQESYKDRYTVTQGQLTQDTNYRIRVVPYSEGRPGGTSDPLFIRTTKTPRPVIRNAPQRRASTSTSITVDFQASDPVAETYRVEYRVVQGASDFTTGPTVPHVQGQTQVAKLEGLTPDTEYAIRITPVSQNVEGVSSPVTYIRTTSVTLPVFRSVPQSRASTPTSITVEFQASDPVAETYRVEYRAQGAADFTRGPTVPHRQGQTQIVEVVGLQGGTQYEIRIIPIIQSGEGPSSQAVSITTQVVVPDPPTTTTRTTTTTTDDVVTVTPEPVSSGGNGGTIAGIIVVIIIVAIIIVVAFFLYRRRKSGKPPPMASCFGNIFARLNPDKPASEVDPSGKPSAHDITGPVHVVDMPDKSTNVVIVPPGNDDASPPSTPMPSVPPTPDLERKEVVALPPIRLEDLSNYIKTKKNQTDAFKEEFKKLPIGPTSKWEVGNKPENRNKNRFLNIRAYDHSRVVLDVLPEDLHSDYINADYISGYGGIEKVYVAAQGPKKGTVEDTWRLVWQTESNRIVMVTNLVEGGRIKCEQYWPNKGTEEYGDMKVTLVSTDNYAAYLIRIFNVERAGESRTIRQFHFTSWPDHGVPTVATELLEFRRRVKSFDKEATGPVVIHCSAGVGRTGTYIAVDICLQQAKEEHEVNVWGTTHQMRKKRVNMIQTLDQYIFVYDAIQEALVSGETIITASNFRAEYGRLCREDSDTSLSKQFATLETLKTPPGDAKPLVALETDNLSKNRYKEIVPSNRYRPFLSSIVEGTTSYINAVYVDGFREKLAYLVTQMPLPHTVVDLWRLMHDHHSSTIVMLNSLDANEKDVGVYWPEDTEHTLNYGPLEVMMTSVDTDHPHITIRDFKIVSTKTRRTPVVRQFQLTSWPKEDTYPESRRSLLELMDMIEKWQQQTGNGPVTIHDMNGASRCGLFVATMYATEQLKVDQAVDVFGAVKQVRIPRPHFIEDIDQYKFVHEMVLEYMSGFGDYSNFS